MSWAIQTWQNINKGAAFPPSPKELGFHAVDRMKYPASMRRLIETFKRLPGVGSKSAERYVFELLRWPEEKVKEFSHLMVSVSEALKSCAVCGALGEEECLFCSDEERDSELLCLVATSRELFLVEETGQFRGYYHVLGGLLSPLQGRGVKSLDVESLKNRITHSGIRELIIAFDSTLEGDATAIYIKEQLKELPVTISRLAFGMPVGSQLEFADGSSLAQALNYRRTL